MRHVQDWLARSHNYQTRTFPALHQSPCHEMSVGCPNTWWIRVINAQVATPWTTLGTRFTGVTIFQSNRCVFFERHCSWWPDLSAAHGVVIYVYFLRIRRVRVRALLSAAKYRRSSKLIPLNYQKSWCMLYALTGYSNQQIHIIQYNTVCAAVWAGSTRWQLEQKLLTTKQNEPRRPVVVKLTIQQWFRYILVHTPVRYCPAKLIHTLEYRNENVSAGRLGCNGLNRQAIIIQMGLHSVVYFVRLDILCEFWKCWKSVKMDTRARVE